MPVAVSEIRARCPECKKIHGKWPWESAYWKARIASFSGPPIMDGGPTWTVVVVCPACKERKSLRGE